MEVELGDGSIHQVPDWFQNVPYVADLLEMFPDDTGPIPLPEVENQKSLCLFMGHVQEQFGNVEDLLELMTALGWANLDQRFTEVNSSGFIESGNLSRRVVELLRETYQEYLIESQNTHVQRSLILELLLQDSNHPLIEKYFDQYIRQVVKDNPWVLIPNTCSIPSEVKEFYYNYTQVKFADIGHHELFLNDPIIENPVYVPWAVIDVINDPCRLFNAQIASENGILPWVGLVQVKDLAKFMVVALVEEHFQFAKALFDRGAKINHIYRDYQDQGDTTALMDAVQVLGPGEVQWLIDLGADVNMWPRGTYGPLQEWYRRIANEGPFFDNEFLVTPLFEEETGTEYLERMKELFPEEFQDVEIPEAYADTLLMETNVYKLWKDLGFPDLSQEMIKHDKTAQILQILLDAGIDTNRKVNRLTFKEYLQGKDVPSVYLEMLP